MRVPFDWLKEFTPVPAAASDVADALTMRGLEVEAVEQIIPRFSGVYVGRVLEVETIPAAEKLSLCRVEVGTDVLPIVCGAPNVARGQTVAVAVPGGRLADRQRDREKTARGRRVFRHALLGKGAWPVGRPQRHLRAPGRSENGRAPRRGPRDRRLRARCQRAAKSGRLPVHPGHREGSGGHIRPCRHPPLLHPERDGRHRRPHPAHRGRHGRLPQVRAAHGAGHLHRPRPFLDEKQDRESRHEAHKRHCRRDELRDAGARPAAPCL